MFDKMQLFSFKTIASLTRKIFLTCNVFVDRIKPLNGIHIITHPYFAQNTNVLIAKQFVHYNNTIVSE